MKAVCPSKKLVRPLSRVTAPESVACSYGWSTGYVGFALKNASNACGFFENTSSQNSARSFGSTAALCFLSDEALAICKERERGRK
jgi:hypothetical protein